MKLFGLFSKAKKKNIYISDDEKKYASETDFNKIENGTHGDGSMNENLQDLIKIYRNNNGDVSNNLDFQNRQTALNKLNLKLFYPEVNYKNLFDVYLKK
ncbi:hypothetical protein [Tenacibaculum piscium]|uniref:hypothetical protein n=1 Tax=Tenacibaculum piscium TaxID=1458515 RepID=UPI00187B4276|nr:hypothetical protein [Tenacibaculum piscium]MBE7691319.1 hypothetical protein [Tenacibaculum piscium]